MTPDITRPSQLWKPLSTERKLQAAEAFWRDGEASLEHAEAIALLTQRLKFRAKSVVALPVERPFTAAGRAAPADEVRIAREKIGHSRPGGSTEIVAPDQGRSPASDGAAGTAKTAKDFRQ